MQRFVVTDMGNSENNGKFEFLNDAIHWAKYIAESSSSVILILDSEARAGEICLWEIDREKMQAVKLIVKK